MPPPGGGFGGSANPTNRASMGSRFGGLVIDFILLSVVTGILGAIFGLHAATSSNSCSGGVCQSSFNIGWGFDLLGFAIGLVYTGYFVGMRTQSIGHRVVGIKVVDLTTGGPIGPGRGALRWFVLGITGAIFTLGYWSPFFDKERHRGWHDKATNSMAVTAR